MNGPPVVPLMGRALKLEEFWRWYNAAKRPKVPGGPERVRRAWGLLKKIRETISHGVSAALAGCARVKAIAMGRLSRAPATAVQLDTALRQKDVIGEREPISEREPTTGILLHGHRWVRGLTWADVILDGVTREVTSRTGAI